MNWLIYESRYSPIYTGFAVAVLLTFLFWLCGCIPPTTIPWYLSSEREFYGMLLLFILIPSYITVCVILSMRRSVDLARQVDEVNHTNLASIVRRFPRRLAVISGIAGFIYAVIFNVPGMGLNLLTTHIEEQATIIGQITVWVLMLSMLTLRIRICVEFYRASSRVTVDLFETGNLKPFAQIGLTDVLIIVCGLILSTVQSLDLSFRPDNYYKALIILVPSIIFLAIYPMWGIHQRLRTARSQELTSLARLIAATPRDLTTTHINNLEILLQRQERVRQASTWPVDTAIVQRFLFYIVIPPLAWVGAALVEFVIDGFITG